MFLAIENEKEEAKKARTEADVQKQEAQKQTEIATAEKGRADKLLFQADSARKKAQAVLDRIYFYEDKFGLAFDKNSGNYGFIDKELNILLKGYLYDEALPFSDLGLAKVKRSNQYFLLVVEKH